MSKLRVLAVCHEDPAHILGGMGRHVRELYRAMAARDDVEIDFVTLSPDESGPYLGFQKHSADRLVCWKPPAPTMASLLVADMQMLKTIMRLYAQGKRWDVIHCHEWGALQVAWAVRDSLGLPLVSTMHLCISYLGQQAECKTDYVEEGKDSPPPEDVVYLWNQEGRLVAESHRLILCSRAYERIVKQTFMLDRKVDVIPNGIRCDEWRPGAGDAARARSLHKLGDRPVALFVGRIADMKGIRPLLDAVEAKDTGHIVVLVGEVNANSEEAKESWDVTKRIRSLCESVPERLRWIGFQHGQELHDLYEAAQVCLMPSIHEPFGIVALETMASGVPLISTEVDGLGEVVCDGDGGEFSLIIPPGDPGALVRAMEHLRDHEESRSELSRLGLARAKKFDWSEVAEQTVRIYHEVLDKE